MSPTQSQTVIVESPSSSGLAIAGLIFSILGWFTCGLLCIPGALLSFFGLFTRGPKGTAIAGLIVGFPGVLFFAFVGFSMIAATLGFRNAVNEAANRKTTPLPSEDIEIQAPQEPLNEISAPEPVEVTFDIPSLLGKTNDEIRVALQQWSEHTEDPDEEDWRRFSRQEQLGLDSKQIYELEDLYSKDGQELQVVFDVRDQRVTTFFLAEDESHTSQNITEAIEILKQRGNLSEGEDYRVEPVMAISGESITGINVIPINPVDVISSEKADEKEQQPIQTIREEPERLEKERKEADEAPLEAEEDAKFRTWTSASGKYTHEAKIMSYANGAVTLENRQGKRTKVPLEKLSQADKDFVKEWREGK